MQQCKRIAIAVTVMALAATGAVASVAAAATTSSSSCTVTTSSPPTSGVTSTPPEVYCQLDDTGVQQPKPLSGILRVTRIDSGTEIVSWAVAWWVTCYNATGNNIYYNAGNEAGNIGAASGGTEEAGFPTADNAVTCAVRADLNAPLSGSEELGLDLEYTSLATSAPSPSPSPSPSAAQTGAMTGYAGKCADDAKNSRVKRAEVVQWKCQGTDLAEQWTYAKGELRHNGLCLNPKGNPASGSKVILWTCNSSAGESWAHKSNGEIALKARGYTLCLTDPAHATKNGTQLMVSTCRNTSDQHWRTP